MSVARSGSKPERRAPPESSDATILRWFSRKSLWIGLVEHLQVPLAVADRYVLLVAAQEEVPHRAQHTALGVERDRAQALRSRLRDAVEPYARPTGCASRA